MPIRHATTRDGLEIPYVRVGSGIPFVHMGWCFGTINALPYYDGWFEGLAERFDFIRYDRRGCGLAPRAIQSSNPADVQADLVAVLEVTNPGRFLLFAVGPEAPAAIDFAVRCPERILGLVLWYPWSPSAARQPAFGALVDQAMQSDADWEVWLRTYATLQHHPKSDRELDDDIATLAKGMSRQDLAVINRDFDASPDIHPILPRLKVPTLVICPRGAKMSRPSDAVDIASRIPLGRAMVLEGSLIGPVEDQRQPALDAIDEFVAECAAPGYVPRERVALSKRESEVLTLVAAGQRNHEVASQLVISERTVARHVSNIYSKLGVHGRAEAAAWAVRSGLV
jgi:DNA-binding CsgD family transcriptional regulator/pimeloyl-ACP methyl ester carboxylesterase